MLDCSTMAGKYNARIAGVMRWLGSAVLNISREDRAQALLSRYSSLERQMNDLYGAYCSLLETDLEPEVRDKANADIDQAEDLADQIRQAVGMLKAPSVVGPGIGFDGDASPALISRLPKLDLPHFSGDLDQWMAFNNLYDSLVHSRKDLTPAQKLAYLLTSLTGEARGLVQHLELIDANYVIARDLLMRRYQNVRRLADCHVSAILALPKNLGTHMLRTRLLNPLLVAYNGLKALELPVVSWSFMLLHIVLGKLPHELRNRFEQEHGGDSAVYLPRFDDLITFLEDECRRVENVPPPGPSEDGSRFKIKPMREERRQSERYREPRIFNASAQQQVNRCAYCRNKNHNVASCADFRQMRWQARRNIARQRNWCYGCLGNHLVSQCRSARPCAQCSGRHHVLLCGNQNGSSKPASPPPATVAPQTSIEVHDNKWTRGDHFVPPKVGNRFNCGYNRGMLSGPTVNRRQLATGGGTFSPPRMMRATVDQIRRSGPSTQLPYAEWPRLDRRFLNAVPSRASDSMNLVSNPLPMHDYSTPPYQNNYPTEH